MIFKTIWERYIFKNLIRTFLFFLLCFFLLYSLVDFSTHVQDFNSVEGFQFSKLGSYYLYQFVKRLSLLLPLALLIATIKVLHSLTLHRELLALQASGLRLSKILRPFFLLAGACAILSLANEEQITPSLLAYLDQSKTTGEGSAKQTAKKKQFTILYLNDASKLVYQTFDREKNLFIDVYWIRSFSDIWKMQTLNADPDYPVCTFADHLLRSKVGFLEKADSYEKLHLPDLKWDRMQLGKKQSSVKYQKISALAPSLLKQDALSFHLKGEIETYFFYKLLTPFIPFLICFGIIPFCVSYSRNPPIFFLYGLSIFCFVVFFTLLNAMVILGEHQTVHPYLAILAPFLLVFGLTYPRFHKLL